MSHGRWKGRYNYFELRTKYSGHFYFNPLIHGHGPSWKRKHARGPLGIGISMPNKNTLSYVMLSKFHPILSMLKLGWTCSHYRKDMIPRKILLVHKVCTDAEYMSYLYKVTYNTYCGHFHLHIQKAWRMYFSWLAIMRFKDCHIRFQIQSLHVNLVRCRDEDCYPKKRV